MTTLRALGSVSCGGELIVTVPVRSTPSATRQKQGMACGCGHVNVVCCVGDTEMTGKEWCRCMSTHPIQWYTAHGVAFIRHCTGCAFSLTHGIIGMFKGLLVYSTLCLVRKALKVHVQVMGAPKPVHQRCRCCKCDLMRGEVCKAPPKPLVRGAPLHSPCTHQAMTEMAPCCCKYACSYTPQVS